MKKGMFFALLVLIPLYTFSAPDRNGNIHGVWEDYRTGLSIQIKPTKRRGILVKRLDNHRRSGWVRYDRIRRGYYDDCNGNTIRVTRNGLRWSKKNGRRTFYLERSFGDFRDRDFYRHNWRDYDWDYDRRGNRGFYNSNDLAGIWHCAVHDIDIDISYYDDGIRVRRYNDSRRRYDDWYTYRRDRNNRNRFYGRDSKYYEIYDDHILFHDTKRGRKLRFKKKRRGR